MIYDIWPSTFEAERFEVWAFDGVNTWQLVKQRLAFYEAVEVVKELNNANN